MSFLCEYYKIFKDTFFYITRPVASSETAVHKDSKE